MPKLRSCVYLLFIGVLISSACVRARYFPEGNIQEGIASWYGSDFHGKSTSSKEVYDMNDLTAAHDTLPFGSYVMVTNLSNKKSVVVRINDRGPYIEGRIIDLSYAAAKALDMVDRGIVRVRIEVLKNLSPRPSSQKYSVQVGSFTVKANAIHLRRKIRSRYGKVYITKFHTGRQTYYRVRIKARTRNDAERIAQRLQADGHTAIVFEER
ncbi:MAG: septal ring lytic transglycosylase RlpA family protein [Candidatus Aminicenantes bacterium]